MKLHWKLSASERCQAHHNAILKVAADQGLPQLQLSKRFFFSFFIVFLIVQIVFYLETFLHSAGQVVTDLIQSVLLLPPSEHPPLLL